MTGGRGVTRRSFIELAFGAITMLPAVVGGGFALTLSPEDAYAADAMPTTQVIVVKGWETGICVVDLTDGKRLPVPDAEVVLTTIGTSKQKLSVTGRTDQNGVFILDMKKLGKPKKDASGTEVYEAQVSIRVRKDGYRVFEVGWFSLKGGNGFEIPTRKVGDEAAYPYRATFNDWDILYTNNEFVVTPANDSDFDLVTCFVAKTSSERIKARLVHIKSPTEKIRIDEAEASVYYDGVLQCYVCRVKMRRPFLLTNHHYGLKPGGKYEIWYELGSTLYKVPLQLSLVACPTGISAPFSKKMTLSPFGDETMKLQVTFPQWVPLFGGQKIVIWKPDLPIDVCFDPFGYLRVAGHIPL